MFQLLRRRLPSRVTICITQRLWYGEQRPGSTADASFLPHQLASKAFSHVPLSFLHSLSDHLDIRSRRMHKIYGT